jgi:hypothetical protein
VSIFRKEDIPALKAFNISALALCLVMMACQERPRADTMPADSAYTPASAPIAVDSLTGANLDPAQNDSAMIAPGISVDSIPEVDRFLVFGLKRIGATRAEITKTLGSPDSTRSEAVENRHMPGQIDSVHHVYYRDAEVGVYAMPTSEMITDITVKSNRLLRLPTFQIGIPWEAAVARLGSAESQASSVRYTCSVCEVEHELILNREGGRVSSIGFSYYID